MGHPARAALITVCLLSVGVHAAPPAPPTPTTAPAPDLAQRLRTHVDALATHIGERNDRHPEALAKAADYIVGQWTQAGYAPQRSPYTAEGKTYQNISVERVGTKTPQEIVIIGAHYDSAWGTPAANDNGSGVAALLALSRALAAHTPGRTLRFVAFTNEEPPHFQTDSMGSLVYARACQARGEKVVAMLSLETMGYYRDAKGSQHYPPPLAAMYPDTGNFVAFVGNLKSAALVKRTVGVFKAKAGFPVEAAALPSILQGVGWSDHWSFWQVGVPAVMVTDTAPFRYPHYHKAEDTAEKLDYPRLAQVVRGLEPVIIDLVDGP